MDIQVLLDWESRAQITGWDFSVIDQYYTQEDPPWDYRQEILSRLRSDMQILDMDTGGGEFLLTLGHPYDKTSVTEAYAPNVALCRRTLSPLGIRVEEADGEGSLPFADGEMDMILNRNGSWNAQEAFRVLKPGGFFITQQVGDENDWEFVELLCPDRPKPFPRQSLPLIRQAFAEAGFEILEAQEAFPVMRFTDLGALVWFAHIIEWEFPNFSVMTHLPQLQRAEELLARDGEIATHTHRVFLAARKPVIDP